MRRLINKVPRLIDKARISGLCQAAFAAAGLTCLMHAGLDNWRFQVFQQQHASLFPEVELASSTRYPTMSGITKAHRAKPGTPIGKLVVPRLGLSSTIVEGTDEDSLAIGVGHMEQSAPLGAEGNIVLAGHRDTALWPLRNIRAGDIIGLVSRQKAAFRVSSVSIVDPSDVRLLQPSDKPILTIVTCYPFRHVGPAPKRFIIQAEPVPVTASRKSSDRV